ncbi:hypothetical protein ACQKH5_03540 [Hyphomonas sp. NPDC076900]|uniref:hypothetical protein n=1 Tax=unclassified Hyphomonas TaxID=2630699 RepID=UPI003D02BA60
MSLLVKGWIFISTILAILSLASIAETIIRWVGFIKEMVDSYRSIRDLLWGNLFQFFDLDLPPWVSDHMTLNAIFSVALLWGLSSANSAIGSATLGSLIQYIKTNILDYTVGKGVLARVPASIEQKVSNAGLTLSETEKSFVESLGKRIITYRTIMRSAIMALLVSVSALAFSYPLVIILRLGDKWDTTLSWFEFGRRRKTIENHDLEITKKQLVLETYDSAVSFQHSFDSMSKLFQARLLKGLATYLIFVAALFLLLVLVNQVATAVMDAHG